MRKKRLILSDDEREYVYTRSRTLGRWRGNVHLWERALEVKDEMNLPTGIVVKGTPYPRDLMYWEDLKEAVAIREQLGSTLDNDLVRIFELDCEEQRVIYEYIRGMDFETELALLLEDDLDTITESVRASMSDILEIIYKLNEEGVIHRDIKPENIITGIRDGINHTTKKWLIDLDYMCMQDDNYRSIRCSKGTAQYMPESVWYRYDKNGLRDLYAVGIMIFDIVDKLWNIDAWPKFDPCKDLHEFSLNVGQVDKHKLFMEIMNKIGNYWEEWYGLVAWATMVITMDEDLVNQRKSSRELIVSRPPNLITY